MKNQFHLLRTKRFMPLFVTQFGGALNDNIFKAVFSVLIAYGFIETGTWKNDVLVSMAAGIFILPFVLFAPVAGVLSDRIDKTIMIRILKLSEAVIVVLAMIGLLINSLVFLMGVLMLLGVQSAFFSPCKFSILPHHLDDDELIAGNGLVNTGTYLAILIGTLCGSLLAGIDYGIGIILALMMLTAIVGCVTSFIMPLTPVSAHHTRKPLPVVFKNLIAMMTNYRATLVPCFIASGWFFFVAATVMSQMPNITGIILHADTHVLAFLMVIFAVGISFGGLTNHAFLKGAISLRYLPAVSLLMAVFAADMVWAMRLYRDATIVSDNVLQDITQFVRNGHAIHIMVSFFILSFLSGLYIVPIKAMIQHIAPDAQRGKVMAMNAMIDAIFIITSSLIAVVVLSRGFTIPDLFIVLTIGHIGIAIFVWRYRHSLF